MVAVARSNEVKALGVKMGKPWFQMQDLARQHGIAALSSNYSLYQDMSNRIMTILAGYSPQIEIYSIDESFLRLTGLSELWQSPTAMGQAMRGQILKWTSLPVCVGISTSKTLAKLANHIAKKQPRFNSVCDLSCMSAAEIQVLLDQIPVGEVWGVGGKTQERLCAAGIITAGDLRQTSPRWLRDQYGVVMERTGNELRGLSCLALAEVAPDKQQIISSKSFGEPVRSFDDLAQAATTYMTRAAEKLRAQQSTAAAVNIFIHTNRFRPIDSQYSNGIAVALVEPSADTRVLTAAALQGLGQIYREGYSYKKLGVMLLDLAPAGRRQASLFGDTNDQAASRAVMAALDSLNARFGRDTMFLASKGTAARWTAKAGNCSPHYTTSWDELPRLREK